MQGMMTLLRVMPQPDYDRMMAAIRNHESGMSSPKGGSR
jgi:hypothetical protein